VVGLFVGFGGFVSFAEERGDFAAAGLLDRLGRLAIEVGRRHDMTPVKTHGGGILLVGQDEEAALSAAFALTEEFRPEDGYLPVHVAVQQGEVMQLDDGQAVKLVARVKATAHPREVQPAKRR
jgi:class 3 adenylate cyclase